MSAAGDTRRNSTDVMATRHRSLDSCDCSEVEASNLAFVKGCLELMLSLEFFQQYKRKSFDLLDLAPGASLLEIGCGTGADLPHLGRLVGASGLVAGIDKSRDLVAEARRQPNLTPAVQLAVADVRTLPFASGRFQAVRVDRTLQHVPGIERAVGELVRVLVSGGTLVAVEPDWETLIVDSDDSDTTRLVCHTLCDAIQNGWIGRALHRHLVAAGMVDVAVMPETFTTSDFATGNEVFMLERTLSDCRSEGLVSATVAGRWLDELRARDRAGEFFGALTLYMVRARKP